MVVGIATLVFLIVAPLIWRKGPEGTGAAFATAALVVVVTALFTMVTGIAGVGKAWRVEAIFCGLVMAAALVSLGIARAS